MVATFRAGKAFTGTFELASKAALIALIDRRVGTVIGDMLVAVIPDIFQRFQVVLDIRVFAVANEAPVGQRRIRRFEVDLVVRVNLFLDIEVEAVGVVALIGHALNDAKFGGIKTAEAIAEVFARRAVQAEAVAGLFFPAVDGVTQTSDDGDAFFTQRVAIVHMLITRQRVDGFVDADIAQRNGGATVFKDL